MAARDMSSLPEDLNAFANGEVFERVYAEGMSLVEQTAAYLDGPGRDMSRELPREANLTYASWSMELTTRLMQAASWLVMQKAVRDGDMLREDALKPKYRMRRDEPALDARAQRGLGLPDHFLDLVERSEGLFERICRLDEALYIKPQTGALSPVVNQWEKLQEAAETGAFDPLSVWGKMK